MWPCCPAVPAGEGTGFASIIPHFSCQAWIPYGFYGSNGALTESSHGLGAHSFSLWTFRLQVRTTWT